MSESTSSPTDESCCQRKARCTHKVTPRSSKKDHIDEVDDDGSARQLFEASVPSPIVLPRKRRQDREVPPRKVRLVDSLGREGPSRDTFRGAMSVKIPAWMTETLKTIPAFLSPKRDRRRSDGGFGGGDVYGEGSLEKETQTSAAGATRDVVMGSRHVGGNAMDTTSDSEISFEKGIKNSCGSIVAPSPLRTVASNIVTQEEMASAGSLAENIVSHHQLDNEAQASQEQQAQMEEDNELDVPQTEEGGVENEMQLDKMTAQDMTDSICEKSLLATNYCIPNGLAIVRCPQPHLIQIDEVGDKQPAKQRPPGDFDSHILSDDGLGNRRKNNTEQPAAPTSPVIITISDDEESESESEAGEPYQHPLSREKLRQKPAEPQPEINRVLTPESLPSAPTPPKRLHCAPLQLPASPKTPPRTRIVKSRWTGHRRASYSRFSGPRIFTPLTLHPVEPGMGLVDRARWPQHEDTWTRPTEELLKDLGSLE